MEDEDVVAQQLHLLLTAYGYNLYNSVNRARADDLLVRQRASGALGDAARHLAGLATEYAARQIPAPTREQPFPPAEAMARLRQIESLRDQLSVLGAKIRGMPVPAQDRTWARFRDEGETLRRLLYFDYELITGADAVFKGVTALTADAWAESHAAEIQSLLTSLQQVARDREQFLQIPL